VTPPLGDPDRDRKVTHDWKGDGAEWRLCAKCGLREPKGMAPNPNHPCAADRSSAELRRDYWAACFSVGLGGSREPMRACRREVERRRGES
jgi:hypothetical protein